MQARYFKFDDKGKPFEVYESHFGVESIAIVEALDTGTWRIEIDQYYSRDGKLVLEITQPLDRALRTFLALIEHDREEEIAALAVN